MNPHYEKRFKNGEDMYHIDSNSRFLAIFDGVGGWITKGIDSGAMTKELVGHIAAVYKESRIEGGKMRSLHEVLDDAVRRVKAKGSTTACLAELDGHLLLNKSGHEEVNLKTCNLGDSGYLLLRPVAGGGFTSLMYKSESQQHYFNCPFQVGNHKIKDMPTKAFSTEHKVRKDDVLILATDGVLDNLFDRDIQYCVEVNLPKRGAQIDNLQRVSDCISTSAEIKGYDEKYESPFTIESRKNGQNDLGGKADDITVIVSQVRQENL